MTGSTSSLAHSRRLDYGEDVKRCEQEKQRGGGGGWWVRGRERKNVLSSSPSFPLVLSFPPL